MPLAQQLPMRVEGALLQRMGGHMSTRTIFGGLDTYAKGGVQVIDDNPKDYAFSNVFDVASRSQPYEKVAVARNLKYVLEAVRAEGRSGWYAASHDEAALVMDGEVELHFVRPDTKLVADTTEGSVLLGEQPPGRAMGWVRASRGHMVLLARGAAYQFRNSGRPAVVLMQTIKGDATRERWAEICQTA
jgi:hypothetical protein